MYDQRFYFAAYLALCSTRQHATFYEVLAVLLDSIYQLRNSLVLNCGSLQNRDTPVRFRFIMQAPVGIEAEKNPQFRNGLIRTGFISFTDHKNFTRFKNTGFDG